MTERLRRVAALYERSAGELKRAAPHARAAAGLFADHGVRRGSAHALAAEGHAAAAPDALAEAATLHAAASRLPGGKADE